MEIEIDSSEIDKAIKQITKEFTDPSRLNSFFSKSANIIKKDVKDHFKKEEGPSGSPSAISSSAKKWEPLKEITKKRKAKKGTLGKGILHDTGTMKRSIGRFHSSKAGGLSTHIKYAKEHQIGKPKKNLPARPFFWFSSKAVDEIIKEMAVRIMKAWEK